MRIHCLLKGPAEAGHYERGVTAEAGHYERGVTAEAGHYERGVTAGAGHFVRGVTAEAGEGRRTWSLPSGVPTMTTFVNPRAAATAVPISCANVACVTDVAIKVSTCR